MQKEPNNQNTHHPHDKGYKELLSNKRAFLSLLKTFVQEDWTFDLQEENLNRVETSYILQDFTEKEADIVYELKTGSDNIIFYCLLELQSTVDYLMPFRLLIYMTEIWRSSFNNTSAQEREKKSYRLPAIIPLVLYNGADKWQAPKQFRQMLAGHSRFSQHLLDFSYILFDINRYEEADLIAMSGLIASVFMLDRKVQLANDIINQLRKLTNSLQNLTTDEYQQFSVWFKHVLKPRINQDLHEQIDSILSEGKIKGVENMITNIEITLAESHQRALLEGETVGMAKGKLEGEAVGMAKGKLEGKLEGKLAIARKLLLRGHTPAEVMELTELTAAQMEELLH